MKKSFRKLAALLLVLFMSFSVMPSSVLAEFRHEFHEHTWEEERAYRLTASLSSLNVHTRQDYPGKNTKKESSLPQTELCLSWGCAGIGIDNQIYRRQIQKGTDENGNPVYEPDPNDYDVSEKMARVTLAQGGYKDGSEYALLSPAHDYPCYWYTTDGETWNYKGPELMYENLRGCWEIDSLKAYGRWVIGGGAWSPTAFEKGPTYTAYKWRGTVKKGVHEKYYDGWDWNYYTYDPYNTRRGEKPVATLKIPANTRNISVSINSVRIYSDGRFIISVRAPKAVSQWGAINFHISAPIAKWSPYYKKGEREWAIAESGYIGDGDKHIIRRGNTLTYIGYIPSWTLAATNLKQGNANIGNTSGSMQNIIDFRPGMTRFDIRVNAGGGTSGLDFVRTNDKSKSGNSRSAWVVLPTTEDYARLDANDPTPTIFNCKKDFIGNVKIDKITQRTVDVSSSAKQILADVEWSCDEYGFNKKTPRTIRFHHNDPDPETYYNGISGYLNVYKCLDSGKEWLADTGQAIGNWSNPETIDSFRADGTGRAHFKSTVVLGYTTDNDCDRYRIEACAFPTPYNATWAYATEHDRVKNPYHPYPEQDNGHIKETGDRGFGESNVYYYNASSTDAAGEMWAGQASPDSPVWAKRYVTETCTANGHRFVLDKNCHNAVTCRYVCEICGEEKTEAHKFGAWSVYEDEEGIKWHSRKCAVCGYEERHAYDECAEIIGTEDTCTLPVCGNCGEYAGGGIAKLTNGHIIAFEDNGDGTHKVYCKQCGYVFAGSEACGDESAWLGRSGVRYDISGYKRDGDMTCVCGAERASLLSLGGIISGGVFDGVSFTALDPNSEVEAKEETETEIETISKDDYIIQCGNDAYINTFETMCDEGKDPGNEADLAQIRAAAKEAAESAAARAEAEYDTVVTLLSEETVSNDIISPGTDLGVRGVGVYKTAADAAARIELHADKLRKNLDSMGIWPSDVTLKIGVTTKAEMESYINSADSEEDESELFSPVLNLLNAYIPAAQIKYNVSAKETVTAEKDGESIAASEKTLTNEDTGISSALIRLPLPVDFGAEGQPVKIEYEDGTGETKSVYALIETDADVLEAADLAESEETETEILEDETAGKSDLRVCFISENPLTGYTVSTSPAIVSEYADTLTSGIGAPEGKEMCTVSFGANSGPGSMTAQKIEKGTSEALKDNAFEAPANKEFDSWNTSPDGTGVRYAANGVITPEGDITLYAIWRDPACEVTFKSRYQGVMENQIITKNTPTALSLNTFLPPDENRVFKCWNTEWDGSGTSYKDGDTVTLGGSELTLYAQWEVPKETYTVTFSAGGGTGEMAPQTFTEGEMQALAENTFSREGYMFRYWITDNNEIYTDGQKLSLSSDINLTAVWVSENVTVNFYQGHGGAFIAAQQIPRNTPTVLRKNTASNPGGAFKCWSNNTGTVTYTDEQEVTFDNKAGETLNLFAEWAGDGTTGVTVTFDRNEDFVYGVMSDYVALSGVETTLPQSTFTHKQKEFAGWNTEADGSGIGYADGAQITVTADTTLYAQWQYKEMNLTLHNGEDTYVQRIRYHETAPIDTPEWTNGDYALVGWTRTEGTQIADYKPGAAYYMISDEDLYAVWASPRTIIFNAGEGEGVMDSVTVPYYNGSNYSEASFALPRCTFTPPEGKVFAFWTRNSADPDAVSKYYDGDTMVASMDYNFYANYTDTYNTVTYHSNYGDDETVKQYVIKDYTKAWNDLFAREGYVFEKWTPNADGTGSQGTYLMTGTDLDLYAKWTKQASVTLCANYGDEPDTEALTMTGSFVSIPQPFDIPEGYEFKNWNTKADGTGKSYFGYYNSEDGDNTLYAQWNKNVTITFHSNNGSGETAQQTFSGYKYLDYNTFTAPEGYAFAGWAETPDAENKKYDDHYFINSNNLTTYDLYAVWKEQVRVTLSANGGVGSYSQVFAKGTSGYIAKFADTGIMAPPGKEFDCWNTKADGTGSRKQESTYGTYSGIVSGDMTLYAQWKDTEKKDVSSLIIFEDQSVTYSGTEQAASSAYIVFDGQDKFTQGTGGAFAYTYKDADGNDMTALPKNAGTYFVTAAYSDTENWGSKTVTMEVVPKPVTVTRILAENKIYDGTDEADVIMARGTEDDRCDGVLFDGLVDGDDLSVTAESARFTEGGVSLMSFDDNMYTGEEKTVLVSGLSLSGDDAGNYTLTNTEAETKATVAKRPLTVEGVTAESKEYDGNTSVTLNLENAALLGVVEGEDVSIESASGAFKNADAGNNKTVIIYSITLTGADAEHYIINGLQTCSADIIGAGGETEEEIPSLKDGAEVQKIPENGNIRIKITDGNTEAYNILTAVKDENGNLISINITPFEKTGDEYLADITEPQTGDSETYIIFIWYEDMKPVIKPITKGDGFFG
ncbi:MAG: InlB B-repeat-containing protein [Clostridia bacterium]|nr:InlB B-repeat-containing protein [Clostridia bacterium]